MDFIGSQVERIAKESGWGEVTIVVERGRVKCVKVTDSTNTTSLCDHAEKQS
jgi:hypothetical protein